MIRRLQSLTGFKILAKDGETGRLKDFLFADDSWAIHLLVVEAGALFAGRQVLLAPEGLEPPEWESGRLPVRLTREQIRNSPPVTAEEPVSRRKAMELHRYYGWNEPSWFGSEPHFAAPPTPLAGGDKERDGEKEGDPHLRSSSEVKGYHLQAADGQIGHLEDFLVDDEHWQIRYLVIDTRNWWPGKQVLLSPAAIRRIGWSERRIVTDLTRANVRSSPEYDPHIPVGREYETRLYDYYGWPKYWV